jgi:hypothetical protein
MDRQELQRILLTKFEEWKLKKKNQEDQLGTALVGKENKKGFKNNDKNENKQKGYCFYCDKPNHTRGVCRRRINDERNGIYRNNIHTPAYV